MASMFKLVHNPKAKATAQHPQNGFALLSVLWLLLLATMLVASIALWTRQSVQTRFLLSQDLRAQRLLHSAFQTIVFDLITEGQESQWAAQDGLISAALTIDGVRIGVVVSADSGKVDVNSADDAMLLDVLRASGASSAVAERVLFKVREAQQARSALPKLASMTEVRTVFGDEGALYACVEPLMTVHTNAARPNMQAAAQTLKDAFPSLAGQRSAMAITSQQLTAQVFRIELGFDRQRWTSRFLLTGNVTEPYWLYGWQRLSEACAPNDAVSR